MYYALTDGVDPPRFWCKPDHTRFGIRWKFFEDCYNIIIEEDIKLLTDRYHGGYNAMAIQLSDEQLEAITFMKLKHA